MKIYEIRFNNTNSIFESCDGKKELNEAMKKIKTDSFKKYLKNEFDVILKSIEVTIKGYVKSSIGATSHNDIYNY